MSDLELYSMTLGVFLPLVISVIVGCHWSDRAKAAASALVYVLAGAGLAYYQGGIGAGNWARSAMMVGLWSFVLYKGLYKPLGISGFIERATSGGNGARGVWILLGLVGAATAAWAAYEGPSWYRGQYQEGDTLYPRRIYRVESVRDLKWALRNGADRDGVRMYAVPAETATQPAHDPAKE